MHATRRNQGDSAGVERLSEPCERHALACEGVEATTPDACQSWHGSVHSSENTPEALAQPVSLNHTNSLYLICVANDIPAPAPRCLLERRGASATRHALQADEPPRRHTQ